MSDELKTYEGLVEANPDIEKIVTPGMAKYMFASSDVTVDSLGDTWRKNMKANLRLFRKHGSFRDAFWGFGRNKAVIAVGGGPSYNINAQDLKDIYEWNLQFPLDQQPFIIVATNKQLKPLLELGIVPHFTILVDAGAALLPQFQFTNELRIKDSFLIAGLQVDPEICKAWDKQGGQIRFWAIGDDEEKKWLSKKMRKDMEYIFIQQGGNVMNTLWILAGNILHSFFFITTGNDLSFKYSHDESERQKSFYADGDYRLNILNLRDEAKDQLGWMGFHNMRKSAIIPDRTMMDLEVMGTSKLLWLYKTWIEVQVALWAGQTNFAFINASEKGILGVLSRQPHGEALFDEDNWYLMDELYKKHWFTLTLKEAFKMFLEMRKLWVTRTVAESAGILDPQMAGAAGIGLIQ